MAIATDGKGNYLTLNQNGEWVPAQRAAHPETGTEMVNDGGTWKPLPGSEPSVVGSALRGVVKGVTFGFGDELRAGTDALAQGVGNLFHGGPTIKDVVARETGASGGRMTMGQAYDASLAASREQDRRDVEVNPVSTVAGQVAGGVGSTVLAPYTGAARVAAPLARAAAPYVSPLLAMMPAWLRTAGSVAGTGAAFGGVAGVGEGEGGLGSRLESGAIGAGTGAAVAPVVHAVTSAVPAVAGRVTHALGLRNPETAADRQIVRALDRGGVTVDEAAARLNAAGDTPTALVDVGGRNVVNLGATAANTPGASMDAADAMVQSRRGLRPDRLMNAGDEAFGGGSGTDVAEATAARRAQRTAEADPLYSAAFGKPAGMTDSMEHILSDPVGQQGLKRGLEIQRIENATRRARGEPEVPTHDPAIRYDENGDPRIVGVPNMRSLDAVKRGMDAVIEDARDTTTGKVKWTERLHAIDDMRRTWVGLLDENNPDYAAARAAWGGPSAQMEATEAGQKALRTNRDIVADRAQRGPQDVQDAYRLGAGRDFADRVSDPAKASGAARTMLEDQQMQARLKSLLGQERLDALNAVLKRETDMTAVERAVSPRAGSQTARLYAGGDDMGRDVAGPVITGIRQAISGHPLQAVGTIANDLLVRRLGQGINPATSDALASRLFVTDQAGRQRVTDALRNRLLQDALRAEQVRALTVPVIRSLAATAGGRAGGP
jgi:hypothetical protein